MDEANAVGPRYTPGLRWGQGRGAIAAALAAARADFGRVEKDRQGQVGPQRYKYATLESVLSAATAALSANGIAVIQSVDTCEGWVRVDTALIHSSGEWVETTCIAPERVEASKALSAVQEAGKMMTYLRRYTLTAMLGVTAEEDDDGAASPKKPKKEAPEEKAERQSGHHPSWEADRARCGAALREHGTTIEDVSAALELGGLPRLSGLVQSDRTAIVKLVEVARKVDLGLPAMARWAADPKGGGVRLDTVDAWRALYKRLTTTDDRAAFTDWLDANGAP